MLCQILIAANGTADNVLSSNDAAVTINVFDASNFAFTSVTCNSLVHAQRVVRMLATTSVPIFAIDEINVFLGEDGGYTTVLVAKAERFVNDLRRAHLRVIDCF